MLINNWKMIYEDYQPLKCSAPCSMYGVLLENKLIKDPFYGLNDLELTKLSEKDCVFESEFIIDEEILSKEHLELSFYGLDTICRIIVNDIILDNVKNMHRCYTYDVKSLLACGTNKIRLEFSSPLAYFEKMNSKHYLFTNGETIKGTSHLRKAFYMSGWDWGPMLPDMGIFRPVCIDAYDTDKIDNIFVLQTHKENKVILDIEVLTKHNKAVDITVSIDGKSIKLDSNKKGQLVIENPKLWWVRGYGEQPLYEITAVMEKDGKTIDKKSQKIGLRTLEVSTLPDKDGSGSEFCFVINGVKIFAKGANYVPQDNILSRINKERSENLIKAAADANFNCIRVWGGGYYPEDEFYDICDEYGMLVWQDFMLACVNVWLTKNMKKEYEEEAIYNVKRLRHHASLGMLCGNNEIEQEVIDRDDNLLIRQDYLELFERIFPEICDEYAPQTFYWPASPSSGGGFNEPNCDSKGDTHFWEVWHGRKPFTEYRKHNFRFCSEYGFESYPSMKTIKAYCEEKDMNCFSRVMENHQKCDCGNQTILSYLSERYLYPVSFETLVYASQILQADAIRYGVEHFRRIRGYCMGSIYWQFNDCWPVASWSSIDSFGRYKALHYAAKKFYAPVSMGLFDENGKLVVNISNETMKDFEGKIKITRSDCQFNIKEAFTEEIYVEALKSSDVFETAIKTEDNYSEFYSVDLFDKDGNFIVRQSHILVPPKYFNWKKPALDVKINPIQDGVEILVSSDCFAKDVYIDFEKYDCVMSDNFFDITDKEPYKIKAKTNCTAEELSKSLQILSVYDIGR